MFLLQSKAIRTVFRWQACATAAMTLHAREACGGCTRVSRRCWAGWSAWQPAWSLRSSPAWEGAGPQVSVLRVALRAEAAKIIAVVLLLWLVLATYKEVVALGFLGAFAVTVVIFSAAIAVRDAE